MLCMKLRAIVFLALLPGCAGQDGTTGISDTQFLDAMTELRQAALLAGQDTAQFMELRAEVLERQGVTESELRAYVAARSRDLSHMAEMWDSVGARLATPVPDPVLEQVVDSLPAAADTVVESRRDTGTVRPARPPRVRGSQ
jgi:hypothetical protein